MSPKASAKPAIPKRPPPRRSSSRTAAPDTDLEGALAAVTDILEQHYTLSEAAPRLLQALCGNLGWQLAEIWVVDRDAELLRLKALWNEPSVDAEGFEAMARKGALGRGTGLVGRVWSGGRPEWITDLAADPIFLRRDAATEAGLGSACAFPFGSGREVSGVVALFSREPRETNDRIVTTLKSIGEAIGRAAAREWALQRSEQHLRSLADQAPDFFAVVGTDGNVLYEAAGSEHVLGYTAAERVGRSILDFVHPDDRSIVVSAFRGAIEDPGSVARAEIRAFHSDGTWHYIESLGRAQSDESGATFIVTVSRDVTERKQMELELKKSAENHRVLFEDSPISLWEADMSEVKTFFDSRSRSGVEDFAAYLANHPEDVAACAAMVKVIAVNRATLALYKAHNVDAFVSGLGVIFGEESYKVFEQELVALAAGQTEFEAETVNYTLASERIHIRFKLSIPPGHEESLSRVFASVVDITQLKEAELALRKSESHFRSLTENVSDIIVVLGLDGTIKYESDAVTRVLGYMLEERLGRNVFDFIHPEDREPVLAVFNAAAQEPGTVQRAEMRVLHKSGAWRYLESVGRVEPAESGELVAIVNSRDVTDRRRGQYLLEQQNRLLEMIAAGIAMEDVLDALAQMVEGLTPAALCSVCLVNEDGTALVIVAAPSLPDSFTQALETGVPIGPRSGSCGTAAYRALPVICSDIASDPLWVDNRDLMLGHGLQAAWSTPILSTAGRVLGTLAMYYRAPHTPQPLESTSVEVAVHIASIAIERRMTDLALARSAQQGGTFDAEQEDFLYTVTQSGIAAESRPKDALHPQGSVARRLRRGEDAQAALRLSEQDIRILELVAQGLTNKKIAATLFLSPHTVKDYLGAIMTKLSAKNRAEAVLAATKLELI